MGAAMGSGKAITVLIMRKPVKSFTESTESAQRISGNDGSASASERITVRYSAY